MESKYFSEYKMAIESVVSYAKSIGFNPENDSFDDLMLNWINHSKKQHEEILSRKEEAIIILKQMVNGEN